MGVGSADYKLGVRDTMRIAENLREPNPGLRWRSAVRCGALGTTKQSTINCELAMSC